MSNNVFSEFNTHGITYKDIQRNELKSPSQTNLDYNINDTFTKSSTKKDFSDDDGKISFKDKLKNFAKGIVSPITTMFSSPKNFAIGAVSIVGISVLVAATGGAITPLLIASGVTMGSIKIAKSAYNAATATTDDEARQAWQGMGAGTTVVAGSVAGAKGALKASGVDTANMSALEATLQCFKSVPSSIGKSFNAFRTGAALTNIKNAFGINKKESSEGTKTDNKSLEETDNIKNETKPEVKADTKPESGAIDGSVKSDTPDIKTGETTKPPFHIDTDKTVLDESGVTIKIKETLDYTDAGVGFENGEATYHGKFLSGKLKYSKGDRTYELTYKNGKIQSSNIYSSDGTLLTEKTYVYGNSNCQTDSVNTWDYSDSNGRCKYRKSSTTKRPGGVTEVIHREGYLSDNEDKLVNMVRTKTTFENGKLINQEIKKY